MVWSCGGKEGTKVSWEGAHLAVLMDIRDELQSLNRRFSCPLFLEIPRTIERIRKNTIKRKHVKKAKR